MLLSPRGYLPAAVADDATVEDEAAAEDRLVLCLTCLRGMQEGRLPRHAIANGNMVGPVPAHLASLNCTERVLVARIHNSVLFHAATRDERSHRVMYSHVHATMADPNLIREALSTPMHPDGLPVNINVVITNNSTTSEQAALRDAFAVNADKVRDSLDWLIENNPSYADLQVNPENLAQYGVDEDGEHVIPATMVLTVETSEEVSDTTMTQERLDETNSSLGGDRTHHASVFSHAQPDEGRAAAIAAELAAAGASGSTGEAEVTLIQNYTLSATGHTLSYHDRLHNAIQATLTGHRNGVDNEAPETAPSAPAAADDQTNSESMFPGGEPAANPTLHVRSSYNYTNDRHPEFWTYTYPHLFSFGVGTSRTSSWRRTALGKDEWGRMLLQSSLVRFQQDMGFLFTLFDMKNRAKASAKLCAAVTSEEMDQRLWSVTAEQLEQLLQHDQNVRTAQQRGARPPPMPGGLGHAPEFWKRIQTATQSMHGSDAERTARRVDAYNLTFWHGQPHLFVTFNPNAGTSLAFLINTGLDMEELYADGELRLPARGERLKSCSRNAVQGARWFSKLLDIFVREVLRFDPDIGRCRADGLFGAVQAYMGAIEEQLR